MTVIARHVVPTGELEAHWIEDCPCEPEIEIKTRDNGADGVVVVHHRRFGEEAA